MSNINEFLHLNGLTENDLILDGTIKEIKTSTFKGWYIGDNLGDGKRSITIEDWRTRDRKSFIEGVDLQDPAERAKLTEIRERYEREKKDLHELKRELSETWIAGFKQEKWKTPSAYLMRKEIDGTFGAILSESTVETTDLIIPMYDKNKVLWNYQTIQDSGAKAFVPGALVDGCYFQLENESVLEMDPVVLICEGFATACSVKMAMPNAIVVCAFSANNLKAVAEIYRTFVPGGTIIICGDDDWKKKENAGMTKAREAATAVHGSSFFPLFDELREDAWTDFNDLHVNRGIQAVKDQIAMAIINSVIPSKEWNESFQAAKVAETKTTKTSVKAQTSNLQRVASLNAIDPYINGVAPLEMPLNKNGQPIIPPEFVVAKALFDYYEGRTVISEDSVFIFDKTHWKEVDLFNEGKILVQIQVLYNGLATNSKLKATFEQFQNLLPKSPRNLFEPRPNVVNFQNGTLCIERKVSKWNFTFRQGHDRNDYCTHMIPIDYDETRSIRNKPFEEMLDRVFTKSLDKDEKIRAIKQMYGACVAPIFPHLFMLYGTGGSGKSSLIIPAQRLVHTDNWSSVEPHEFKGFTMESMAGKLVNIVLDINTREPIEDSHIKKIEDRVPVRIDRKFKTSVKVPLPAVHIFGGNEIPATYEKGSGAHERRWTFLHIEGFKAVGNYSKNFANEIFDECPQGVLNFALDGLMEILETNGHYFVPESGSKKMREWQMEHDPVALFVHEIAEGEVVGFRFSADGRALRTAVWSNFVSWYETAYNRKPRIGKTKFYDALQKVAIPGVSGGGKIELVKVHGDMKFTGIEISDAVDRDDRN